MLMETQPISGTTSLTAAITQCHRRLDEIFLLHQEEILQGNLDEAIKLFRYFRKLHRIHMDFEDQRLIPVLAEPGHRGRWPASLYSDEHAKVSSLMAKTESSLITLGSSRSTGSGLRREIIAFLDQERTFKRLCEHHQEREEIAMLPELDELTGAEWRSEIIEAFLKEWHDCALTGY